MSTNRLLAFFDILGFKALIAELPLDDLVKRFASVFHALYSAAIRHSFSSGAPPEEIAKLPQIRGYEDLQIALREFGRLTAFQAHIMSDSIVLYSEPMTLGKEDFDRGLVHLLRLCRTLMLRLFEFDLPARGGVSFGEFHADPSIHVYVGRGLVDAYLLSEAQEWIGTAVSSRLSPEIERLAVGPAEFAGRLQESGRLDTLRRDWDVIPYPVPLKSGEQQLWAVNWVSAWNVWGSVPDDYFSERLTGEERVDRKYKNTLRFMQQFRGELTRA